MKLTEMVCLIYTWIEELMKEGRFKEVKQWKAVAWAVVQEEI